MARQNRAQPAPEGPGPYAVIGVQVDEPLASLEFDDGCTGVMVVAWRGPLALGAATFDFAQLDRPVAEVIADFVAGFAVSSAADVAPLADILLPSISVVVPTIVERLADIELLMTTLGRLDYPDVEFLIVDNRRAIPENDELPRLVSVLPHAKVVRAARPGISSARNAGVAAATGDFIAFADDDARVEKNWLRAIGTRFVREPGLDAVTGLILPAELETPAQIWFERYYGGFAGKRVFTRATIRPEPGRGRMLRNSRATAFGPNNERIREFAIYGVGAYGAGVNMAIRRSAIERIGGFNLLLGVGTPSRGGEDLDAFIRLLWTGGAIGYEPAATVYHRHRREYTELLHQLDGYGVGFTAILYSLVRSDPRHLLSILSQLRRAVPALLRNSAGRFVVSRKDRDNGARPGRASSGSASASASPSASDSPANEQQYPRQLLSKELGGYPAGPFAYERAAREGRRWERAAARAATKAVVGTPREVAARR